LEAIRVARLGRWRRTQTVARLRWPEATAQTQRGESAREEARRLSAAEACSGSGGAAAAGGARRRGRGCGGARGGVARVWLTVAAVD
jgi:hypothetical protein